MNIRLLFNFVKVSLATACASVRGAAHRYPCGARCASTWSSPSCWDCGGRPGAFGSDAPAQVFTVECDAKQPPADVDVGIFRLEVYFYAARPVETVLIIVGQQPSGASVSEGFKEYAMAFDVWA